ncbi:MAG: hypothetical protein V8S42_00630 [Lachnospiraceae bacterium]
MWDYWIYRKREASEIMLDVLELLEYRGYDSAGIALFPENGGPVRIFKKAGRVHDLRGVSLAK